MGFSLKKKLKQAVSSVAHLDRGLKSADNKVLGGNAQKIVNTQTVSYVLPLQTIYTKAQRKTPVGQVVTASLIAGAGVAGGVQVGSLLGSINDASLAQDAGYGGSGAVETVPGAQYAGAGSFDWTLLAIGAVVVAVLYYGGKKKLW